MNKGTALGGAAFVLSAGLVVQQWALQPEPIPEITAPIAANSEVPALRAKIQALEARLAALEEHALGEPAPAGGAAHTEPAAGTPSKAPADSAPPEPPGPDPAQPAETPQTSPQDSPPAKTFLSDMDLENFDEVIEEKFEELKQKWNKKPGLKAVAKLLELDASQARVIEDEVRKGQVKLLAILDQPMADGTSLLDHLVEVMAHGQTPKAGELWGQWLARLQSEKVPGMDLTYAARLEQAKGEVRDGFRRVMSPEQYSEFEEWDFDPTGVQGISESPWSDFGERVAARAAELAQQRQE